MYIPASVETMVSKIEKVPQNVVVRSNPVKLGNKGYSWLLRFSVQQGANIFMGLRYEQTQRFSIFQVHQSLFTDPQKGYGCSC